MAEIIGATLVLDKSVSSVDADKTICLDIDSIKSIKNKGSTRKNRNYYESMSAYTVYSIEIEFKRPDLPAYNMEVTTHEAKSAVKVFNSYNRKKKKNENI